MVDRHLDRCGRLGLSLLMSQDEGRGKMASQRNSSLMHLVVALFLRCYVALPKYYVVFPHIYIFTYISSTYVYIFNITSNITYSCHAMIVVGTVQFLEAYTDLLLVGRILDTTRVNFLWLRGDLAKELVTMFMVDDGKRPTIPLKLINLPASHVTTAE